MNFVLNNYQVDEQNISFLETKKNNIIDGNFTKIIYKDTFVTVNGIYLLFPIITTSIDKSNDKSNAYFNPKIAANSSVINHISDIESKIIECYKHEYHVSHKKNMSTLFNQLYNGKIKLYKETNYTTKYTPVENGMRSLRDSFQKSTSDMSYNSTDDLGGTEASFARRSDEVFSGKLSRISSFSTETPSKIVLKISGIWETTNEIGITYKFLDMH
jgi:hypothetical protein